MLNYQNKYFSILGDSISTLAWRNPPECEVFYSLSQQLRSGVRVAEDTWWGRVVDALGGRMLVNNSWSGSLVCRHERCEIPSYGCSDARTSRLGWPGMTPDVIMVFMGMNDWGRGMPVDESEVALGVGSDARPDSNLAVFSVAYRVMLDKIRCNYPAAQLWCFTLPIARRADFPYTYGGRHIDRYCEAIREAATQVRQAAQVTQAAKAFCHVVDLRRGEPYTAFDGFHPDAAGMKTIAETVLGEVQKWSAPDGDGES